MRGAWGILFAFSIHQPGIVIFIYTSFDKLLLGTGEITILELTEISLCPSLPAVNVTVVISVSAGNANIEAWIFFYHQTSYEKFNHLMISDQFHS